MATPDRIRHYTANNPGIMTLQGTNQYVVGKENVPVIDVALSADSNMDGIIEQAEAMGAKKIEKILLTHIHSDHCGGALALRKRCGAKLGIRRSRAAILAARIFNTTTTIGLGSAAASYKCFTRRAMNPATVAFMSPGIRCSSAAIIFSATARL